MHLHNPQEGQKELDGGLRFLPSRDACRFLDKASYRFTHSPRAQRDLVPSDQERERKITDGRITL